MSAFTCMVEVFRRPEDVFAYATNFDRFPEWQASVVSASAHGNGPVQVGSTAAIVRRVGPGKISSIEQITEYNPPQTWTVRSVGKLPVIAIAKGTVEPLAGGEHALVTIALEFQARGIGRLIVPVVIRPQAHNQLAENAQALKRQLECGREDQS